MNSGYETQGVNPPEIVARLLSPPTSDPLQRVGALGWADSLDHKAYGFCYDDVSEQAAFFSGKGQNLIVTLYWDLKRGDE